MDNQNTTITLDNRIKTDIEDLYNSGILKFIEQFKNCKIKAAEQLSKNLFGTPNELSSHGLPGYFAGKRDAKTVMVMLNPGSDVISQDNPFVTEKTLKKLGINIVNSDEFVNTFQEGCKNFGNLDLVDEGKDKGKIRIDNFDIKQAAFLKAWDKDKSEVDIPDKFPDMLKNLPSKPSKKEKEDRDDLLRKTKQKVLMSKLQLELIPYASREFKNVKPNKMHFLFPYLETLFYEIFFYERNYVIFCSDFFEKLFKKYSKDRGGQGCIQFEGLDNKPYMQLFKKIDKNGKEKETKAYCTPIKITYNKGEAMTSIHAVIAHTFPNKALPNAYDKMQEYGKFCFEKYNEYKNLIP